MSPVEFAGPEKRERRKSISIRQVDAFTEMPLTGNPAGVVAEADGLTDEEMQKIAREMAVSETAFVFSPKSREADIGIRWFTPLTEVPLCGHATIAAFHVLAEEGLLGMKMAGTFTFRVETKSGLLPVSVTKGAKGIDVRFGLLLPKFRRVGQYKLDAIRILNINLDQLENRMPVVATDSLFVPIRRLHTLFSMKPDFTAMEKFLANRGLIGLCAFTTETIDKASAVHSRFFAPPVGINEDPVTGSTNGPLGAYLFEFGKQTFSGNEVTLVGEQGDEMGRPGRVSILMSVTDKKLTSLAISGRAVTVLGGEMAAS